jgi:hypothetical protein
LARLQRGRARGALLQRDRNDCVTKMAYAVDASAAPQRMPNKYANAGLHVLLAVGAFLKDQSRNEDAESATSII